jgi:WXG100 family type VII secretion target
MGSGRTATDSALMEQTAKKFESVDQELMSLLSNLRSRVDQLQASWVGAGGTSFTTTMNTWSDDQKRINDLLRETAELIRTSGQSYSTTDTNAASRLNGVGNQTLGL